MDYGHDPQVTNEQLAAARTAITRAADAGSIVRLLDQLYGDAREAQSQGRWNEANQQQAAQIFQSALARFEKSQRRRTRAADI